MKGRLTEQGFYTERRLETT